MFYERFKEICYLNGVKPTNVLNEINVGMGNTTNWKTGTLPNGSILIEMADYFGCSIDYLLGRTDNPDVNKKRKQEVDKDIVDFLKNIKQVE